MTLQWWFEPVDPLLNGGYKNSVELVFHKLYPSKDPLDKISLYLILLFMLPLKHCFFQRLLVLLNVLVGLHIRSVKLAEFKQDWNGLPLFGLKHYNELLQTSCGGQGSTPNSVK